MIYTPKIHHDERGYFFEAFRADDLPAFVQDNVSFSRKGVVRGFHYQTEPMAQGKYIRCMKGKIFDVMIDLKTMQTYRLQLDDETNRAVYIPPGYAHGFQALEDSLIYYKCTQYYSKEHEAGFNPLDFHWPLQVTHVSQKDLSLPRLKDLECTNP